MRALIISPVSQTYHARAWKRIPAQPDSIAILDVAPLVLEGLVVHVAGKSEKKLELAESMNRIKICLR
jgi:hypothetical protein